MAPAAVLPVEPGDKVLDLCAAPGGKSTELGAKLKGEGLLVSNDISNSRAKALLKNLELFGNPNICVTSETPEKLASVFGPYFDKILVDAPCSGEGMFRKDPDLIKSWQERGPEYYAPIQRQILASAVSMLKPAACFCIPPVPLQKWRMKIPFPGFWRQSRIWNWCRSSHGKVSAAVLTICRSSACSRIRLREKAIFWHCFGKKTRHRRYRRNTFRQCPRTAAACRKAGKTPRLLRPARSQRRYANWKQESDFSQWEDMVSFSFDAAA